MHIPFFGPIVLIITFGLGFLIADKLVSKFLRKERVIMGGIDKALKKISGNNILIELIILIGAPFFLAFFVLDFFSDEYIWYWLVVAIEMSFFGYLGAKWWEN